MPGQQDIMQFSKKLAPCILLLAGGQQALAHAVNLDLEKALTRDVVGFYLNLGIEHIVPLGTDHILFVLALCLLSNQLKTIFWQATAFTIAHSISLALSMKGTVHLPAGVVEPLIALSIVFVAVENVLTGELKAWRVLVVFLFGLIHGLGFAAVLNDIGLPRNKFFTSLLSFNAGVEIGQVIIILLTFLLLVFPLRDRPWYKKRVVFPLSVLIAVLAAYWTIERTFS